MIALLRTSVDGKGLLPPPQAATESSAAVLEDIGVSANVGAGAAIHDPGSLTEAGSIVAVEVRIRPISIS